MHDGENYFTFRTAVSGWVGETLYAGWRRFGSSGTLAKSGESGKSNVPATSRHPYS